MTTWTRITDPDDAATLLPAWFAGRMMGESGAFGFLTTGGDVLRVRRISAIHASSAGAIFLDVWLDHAGVPDDVDLAWRSKHYLGAPIAPPALATLNLAHIVIVVAFEAPDFLPDERVDMAFAEPASAADLADAVASWPAPAT